MVNVAQNQFHNTNFGGEFFEHLVIMVDLRSVLKTKEERKEIEEKRNIFLIVKKLTFLEISFLKLHDTNKVQVEHEKV